MEDGKLNSNPSVPEGNFRGHAKQYVCGPRSPIPCLQRSVRELRVVNISAVFGCRLR